MISWTAGGDIGRGNEESLRDREEDDGNHHYSGGEGGGGKHCGVLVVPAHTSCWSSSSTYLELLCESMKGDGKAPCSPPMPSG